MYQKALDQVHSRNDLPIWQSIIWELSSAYFNLADQLQSRPPLRSQEAEEVCIGMHGM